MNNERKIEGNGKLKGLGNSLLVGSERENLNLYDVRNFNKVHTFQNT